MNSRLIHKYRYSLILLRELVVTEFKLRYQGSALGYVWSLLRPLFLFMIMYVVFVYFLKVGEGVEHWPVQLLLGIVLWNFFSEITNNGITSIVNRGDVMRKINFPKYVIVLATSLSALVNLLINLVVVAAFMIISGVSLHASIVFAPFYIAELFALGLGIAFLLGSLFVKLRDINYIWEIVMQGLFYASVVIYPITLLIDKGHHYAQIFLLNPVAQVIQNMRHDVISQKADTLFSLTGNNYAIALLPIALTALILVVGAAVFKKRSPYFAENI